MGITCQYDKLKNVGYLGDLTRKITVEAKLTLPEDGPRIGTVLGGDFLIDSTAMIINDDLLVMSGKLRPRLMYTEDKPQSRDNRHVDYDEERGENEIEENPPLEYGYSWMGDDGPEFGEQIDIPGLRKEMFVQVEARPGKCMFEKNGGDRVGFRGELHFTIHVSNNQEADIMNDVVMHGPEKLVVNKEHVMVEEVIGVKQATVAVRSSLVLPGIKPGVARILNHHVRPSSISCEVNRGRVLVKGFLDVNVIYVGSDDAGRSTEVFVNEWGRESGTALPFETVLENGIGDEETILIPRVSPRNITLDLSSPHELLCKMDLECEVKVSRVVTKDMVVSVTPDAKDLIDTQRYLLNFEEYGGETSGDISLDTTLDLPGGVDGLDRLLNYHAACSDFKTEVSGNNVLVNGNLDLWLTYVSGGSDISNIRMVSWEKANDNGLPVAGMLELSNLQPSSLCNTQLTVESLRLEPVSERSVKVTGTVKVRVIARNPRAVFVLKDCAVVVPVEPSSRPSMMFYVVQPGDTLWKVARRYQTTVDMLIKANQVTTPEHIQTGQKLLIPKVVG